jgi:hypothetical protein
MLSAEAHVSTERASRYLVQLCEHLDHIAGQHRHQALMHAGAPPQARTVEWSDTHGVITFDGGHCTLDATPDTLTLHVDAVDADSLHRIQVGLAHRLETIGRRDQLTVAW